nr:hypothetical protein [Streptomyces sp. S10(2018)]
MPQVAYAAPPSNSGQDGGKGVFDTVSDWLGDDEEEKPEPPSYGGLGVADRQKLPKGKNAPKAERVKELTSRRTPAARFWQLSDGRVEAELTAAPTSYQDPAGKSWKAIDTRVAGTGAKGFDFANTTNVGRSWFGSDPDRLLRYEAGDGGQSVTLGLQGTSGRLKPEAKDATVTYEDAVGGADLSYVVGPGRVKENITLSERPAGIGDVHVHAGHGRADAEGPRGRLDRVLRRAAQHSGAGHTGPVHDGREEVGVVAVRVRVQRRGHAEAPAGR